MIPPALLLGSGLVSSSLLAHILNSKYVLSLPFYRQEQEFQRLGVPISRQTMANWVIMAHQKWFAVFFQPLRRELLTNSILHADETTLMVLKEPGRKARQKSYAWVYRTSGDSPGPVVLYDYRPTRAGECASNFLSGFSGMLHTDGYKAYHCKLPPEITWRDAGRICAGSLQTHSRVCQKKCGTDLRGRWDWGSATNDSRLRRTTKNGVFLSARGFRPGWSEPSRQQRPSSPGREENMRKIPCQRACLARR